ncbi:PREDICTED: UPF0235 protein C15orf40 homolog [Nicrophorus vespilloides]|uniref:UPF0235 protein C15orf40 homolog n=1 Tax=Nicrophorus vespilloides TaxID=110193 RepID=A0ABM1NKE7_NICVS|nr:PREDICTED: UPF0235 protein C15orf40 homolog [Nicrophorus vespilloides]
MYCAKTGSKFLNILTTSSVITTSMSKKASKKGKSQKEPDVTPKVFEPICLDKSKHILIHILAKPGAKQNSITDITEEGVGVQINAPPAEGEANTELVKYISSVLGVRKGDVSLEKGFKSRQKTIKVLSDTTSLDQVKEKINAEMKR